MSIMSLVRVSSSMLLVSFLVSGGFAMSDSYVDSYGTKHWTVREKPIFLNINSIRANVKVFCPSSKNVTRARCLKDFSVIVERSDGQIQSISLTSNELGGLIASDDSNSILVGRLLKSDLKKIDSEVTRALADARQKAAAKKGFGFSLQERSRFKVDVSSSLSKDLKVRVGTQLITEYSRYKKRCNFEGECRKSSTHSSRYRVPAWQFRVGETSKTLFLNREVETLDDKIGNRSNFWN